DPDGARRLVPKLAERIQLSLDFLQARAHRVNQAFARFCWRDSARSAGQQPNAKPFLQSTDGVAQRRLRHPELRRRPGEAPLARDSKKGEEIVEVLPRHS